MFNYWTQIKDRDRKIKQLREEVSYLRAMRDRAESALGRQAEERLAIEYQRNDAKDELANLKQALRELIEGDCEHKWRDYRDTGVGIVCRDCGKQADERVRATFPQRTPGVELGKRGTQREREQVSALVERRQYDAERSN